MRKLLAIVLSFIAVGVVVWFIATFAVFWFTKKPYASSLGTPPPAANVAPGVPASTGSAATADAPPPPLAPRLPGTSVNAPLVRTNADPANPDPTIKPAPLTAASAASPDIRTDLEEVLAAIRDFRTSLGGNPVGTNAEITKALLGDNLKQIKVPLPAGSSINANREMCDRWGTPYFFHQLSGDKMEVRSAGPDRQMWTADDRQM